jgi:hypothetical protein
MKTRPTIPPLQYNWHYCDWHNRQNQRHDRQLIDWVDIKTRIAPEPYLRTSPLYFSYHLALAHSEYPAHRRSEF